MKKKEQQQLKNCFVVVLLNFGMLKRRRKNCYLGGNRFFLLSEKKKTITVHQRCHLLLSLKESTLANWKEEERAFAQEFTCFSSSTEIRLLFSLFTVENLHYRVYDNIAFRLSSYFYDFFQLSVNEG
jgi:hypothetical protein